MDEQQDAPTWKVDSGDEPRKGTSGQQRDTPTEKVGPEPQWQAGLEPPVRPPEPGVQTEILDRRPLTFAWLVIAAGPQRGTLHRLSADVTSIGRHASNTLRLGDEYVSRQHAKVRVEEGDDGKTEFYLYDLASSAGVFVNGERVYRHKLSDGDRIQLGRTELVFKRPARLVMEEADDG